MQQKKAQVSLYIILGLIVLAVVAFLAVRKPAISSEETLPVELQPAKEYVQWCLQQSLDTAVRTVALQGGYATAAEERVIYPLPGGTELHFPYHVQPNAIAVPSSAQVAAAVAALSGPLFQQCLANVSSIRGYTLLIEETPKLNIPLSEEQVEAISTTAITLAGEQSRYSIQQMRSAVALPLGRMRDVAAQIAEVQQQNMNQWCVTCIADLADDRIDIVPEFTAGDGNTIILYRLLQRTSAAPLIFLFAHQLPFREPSVALHLPSMDRLAATVGREFLYTLPLWDGEVLYSDDSPLFDIDPFNGAIRFLPTASDIGTYVTTITMKAADGDFAQETFVLEVTA